MVSCDGEFAPGIMIYFVLKGNPEKAQKRGRAMMNHIAGNALAITLAVSLGNIRTLVEHPSSMTHAPIPIERQLKAGIEPGGIRISLGIENVKDIIKDHSKALEYARDKG